jgi:periplasmic protein TonB
MSYQALLFCPDEKTAKLVTQILSELDFSVEPSNEPFNAVKRLMAQHFDAVVVDCDNEQNATLLFKSARNSASNQSSLAVAVVEGQAGVAKAFRIGANLVLTKPINVDQAKGTLRVARGLLKKGDASKATTPAAAAPTGSAPAFTPTATVQPAVARPQAPVQKTAFTQTVPKAPVIPPAQPQYAQAHASAASHEVQESAVLDLPPDLAPSSKSAPVRPAQKEYAWQPVSKPSGPMANAFQQAATQQPAAEIEDVVDAPESAEFADAEISEEAPAPPVFSTPITASAASAPAPARQKVVVKPVAVKPVVKPFTPAAKVPAPVIKHEPKPAAPANKLTISAPALEEAPAAPTFVAHAASAPEKSGNRGVMIAVVAVVVLAAGGYFGWTKLHKNTSVQAPAPVQQASTTQPAASTQTATSPAPAPVVSEPKPSAEIASPQSTKADATPSTVKAPAEADKKNSKPAVAAKNDDSTAEDTEGPAAPQPMIVKGGSVPKISSQSSAPVAAPEPVMASAGSGEKNLAGIVSGMDVAKPVEQALRVSQGVLQGRIIKRIQPVYPSMALRLRIQGTVQLAATVSKDGDVTNVKQISGDHNLGQAAIEAVRQWKYKPYLLDGKPTEVQTQISVDFKLPS